jgi:hypothetical protein
MGVMTDFFLASTSDVARVLNGWQLPQRAAAGDTHPYDFGLTRAGATKDNLLWAQPPRPNPHADPSPKIASLPNVQCKGMLPDKLALLFTSLTEVPAERALDLILNGFLTGPPETEVTVQLLPKALTKAIAQAESADLVRAAKAIEEDEIDQWGSAYRVTASDLANVLHRVQSLAQRGVDSDADLFIWTCT